MKLPAIPPGWPRYVALGLFCVAFLAFLFYGIPQIKSAVVNYLIAGREAELRQEIEGKLQPAIDQAKTEQAAAKQEADRWRAQAAAYGQQVAKLQKERAALQSQVAQAGAALQTAREDAAHVADVDLLPRIRGSLGRLRAGG